LSVTDTTGAVRADDNLAHHHQPSHSQSTQLKANWPYPVPSWSVLALTSLLSLIRTCPGFHWGSTQFPPAPNTTVVNTAEDRLDSLLKSLVKETADAINNDDSRNDAATTASIMSKTEELESLPSKSLSEELLPNNQNSRFSNQLNSAGARPIPPDQLKCNILKAKADELKKSTGDVNERNIEKGLISGCNTSSFSTDSESLTNMEDTSGGPLPQKCSATATTGCNPFQDLESESSYRNRKDQSCIGLPETKKNVKTHSSGVRPSSPKYPNATTVPSSSYAQKHGKSPDRSPINAAKHPKTSQENSTNQEDVPCNKQLSEIMADDNTTVSVTMAATSLSKISPWLVASENITPPTLLAKSKPETVTRKTVITTEL
ncbi:unnamed protein product, partial [Timema podura]|nr:unnamed protein product [Timema podura]